MIIRIALGALIGLGAAQYRQPAPRPNDTQLWLITPTVSNTVRICASRDPSGVLRGCVTVKELRDKAAAELATARR